MIEYEAKMIGKKIHEMVGHLELDFYTGNRLVRTIKLGIEIASKTFL